MPMPATTVILKNPLFTRRVVLTPCDPIPREFRTAPGAIAINHREYKGLLKGDGETFKMLAAIVEFEDGRDLENREARPRARRPSPHKRWVRAGMKKSRR